MIQIMRRHCQSLACISTLVLIAPGCAWPRPIGLIPKSSDTKAIRELLQQRVHDGNSGDVNAWVDCFTDDAIIMPANAPAVVGKEAIEEWERGFEGFRPQVEMTIDEVVVHGDWSYMRSRSSGVFIKGGERFPIEGKELAILRRVQGQWKYHRLCGNKDTGRRFEKDEEAERGQ